MLSILVRFWFAVWRWLKFKVNPPQYDFLKAGEERIRLADWKHSVAMAAFDFEMAVHPQRMKLLCGPAVTVQPARDTQSPTQLQAAMRNSDRYSDHRSVLTSRIPDYGGMLQNAYSRSAFQEGIGLAPLRAYAHACQQAINIPPQPTYGTPASYVPIEFPKVLFGSGGQRIAGSMAEQIALIGIGYKEHP